MFSHSAEVRCRVSAGVLSRSRGTVQLSELIHDLKPGDEVVVMENNHPVARLIPTGAPSKRRTLGSLRGAVRHMAPDFDAPLGSVF